MLIRLPRSIRRTNRPTARSITIFRGGGWRAFRKEGQLWHSEALQLAAGGELPLVERPVKYLVGSGRFRGPTWRKSKAVWLNRH